MDVVSTGSLDGTRLYLDRLRNGQPAWEVYEAYIRDSGPILGRSQFEWRLAASLVEEQPAGQDPGEVPATMRTRPSGAMIDWVAGQQFRRERPPQGCLAEAPVLTAKQAVLFARAWALWPENPALAGRHEPLCLWLGRTRDALGWAAVALAAAETASAQAVSCAARWLQGPLRGPAPDALAAALLAHPALRPYGLRALRRLLVLHRREPAVLKALRRVAATAGCYGEVLAAAELHAQVAGEAFGPDAEVLVAFVRRGAEQAALDAYRKQWFEPGIAFPDPLVLLPVLYRADDANPDGSPGALRRYVLNHHTHPEEAPTWKKAWLRAEARDLEDQWETTLPIWFSLFTKIQDEAQREQRGYFLVRLTEAFLEAPPDIRRALQEEFDLDLRATWSELRAHNPEVAEAALLLLETSPQQRIERYRTYLAGLSLSRHRLVRRAARAYLEALLDLHYWDELAALFRRLRAGERAFLGSPEDIYFLEGMIQVREALHAPDVEADAWCYRWESLLSLSLADTLLIAALDHFAKIRGELRRQGHPLTRHAHVADVELQLTRRGKAMGERMLARSGLGRREAEVWRQRLESAMLIGLVDLLREMSLRFGGR